MILADWIASDAERFPYALSRPQEQRLAAAVETLDLCPPWSPEPVSGATDLFPQRFPHLADHSPSALQTAAVEAALAADSSPMLVIEAPTGGGKSEAALMAAEALAARFGCGGVFLALPTMATSNAMFSRVLRWVEHWGSGEDPALWLAHGKAQLNEDFAGLVRASWTRSVFDEESPSGDSSQTTTAEARVSGWLFGRKKGLLANVVVGTIDQVLMGALQSRHLVLRHLALSGKVVIIDEVHSVDAFMGSYLERVLEYLGAYGTPVVLLSATLAPVARAGLVGAYQGGRASREAKKAGGLVPLAPRRTAPADGPWTHLATSVSELPATGPGPEAYPLVTTVTATDQHLPVVDDTPSRSVTIEAIQDTDPALVHLMATALEHGGCVAVLRNTVRRAQETYDLLREHYGDDVELFHSRFLACDRAERERDLLHRLGPGASQRPRRLIIVGTQVLEQSLDIDLDLLVTDIAPVDLLIQRIGRLHRHPRADGARPLRLRQPRCVVTGIADWDSLPPRPEKGALAVYDAALLYRSLAVLQPALAGRPLSLPSEAPRLVHAAYDPAMVPPPGWEDTWEEAGTLRAVKDENSRDKAGTFQVPPVAVKTSLTDWVRTPGEDSDERARAAVRDTEDGIEVIVVQRTEQGLRMLPGDFAGASRDIPIQPEDRDPLTRQIAACTVNLPQALTKGANWHRTVSELEATPEVAQWQESRWLGGELVLILDESLEATLNGHLVTYSSERGLDVTPIRQESRHE
ncbi:CRISPR-associated helicase Cas3' [Ornithinimicrobium cavernae]|uniref:CRISPR-associated helicase Cas3' n=1 Tax=Ornithinimicrobium cavernae TaxID=2666047 RepID=UPI000D6956AC|nr:CRISPR-associated helicase Cas3' [Ornithinimicrobium cavernae]